MRRLWVRLFLAFMAVAIAGGVAAYAVGALVGHDAVRRGLRLGATGRGRGAGQGVAENTDAFDAALRDALVWGLVTAVVVGIVVAVVVSRYLARPVEEMQLGARRMARGDYGVRVSVGGPSELSALGEDVNLLAGTLEETEVRRTRLLSELAHELRSPLTSIDGYVEGLLDGVFEADAAVLASIQEETSRLRRLAGDLTTVARAEEGALGYEWERVDLTAVASNVVGRLRPQFDASSVTLVMSRPPGALSVRGDAARLDQAITNLVGNALGHTPKGGTVTVAVDRDGSHVRLRVIDDGEGIAPAEVDRIFERFYRGAGTARSGSGLGLTIVRAIITAHDGEVVAESAGHGAGTTFTVRVPVHTNPGG
jgi:histidine kinase